MNKPVNDDAIAGAAVGAAGVILLVVGIQDSRWFVAILGVALTALGVLCLYVLVQDLRSNR